MWGLWSESEFEAFYQDFIEHVDRISSLGGSFYLLVDLSEFPAQKAEVRERIKKGMQYALDKGMKKSARIVAKQLTNFQMQRLAEEVDPSKFGHFHTNEDALDWLFNK